MHLKEYIFWIAAPFLVCLTVLVFWWLYSTPVLAASLMPAVNQEMSCTVNGQILGYNGTAIVCQAPSRPVTTVGGLPACNSGAQGFSYFVTDALAPVGLAIVAGSGAVKVGVICNGTNWIVQ